MSDGSNNVVIFAPVVLLTVTVEAGPENGAEVHLHPGGQGFWVARMLRHLGERPLLCGPVGGESGGVIRGLLAQWGIDLSPVEISAGSPVIVQDRRGGDRVQIAETPMPHLTRHEQDDLYGTFLDHALNISTAVVTGQWGEVVPLDEYKRLGHDLETGDVDVIGDLHGPEMRAFIEGGRMDVLKVSDQDLREDGVIGEGPVDMREGVGLVDRLVAQGARNVILSLAEGGALASLDGDHYRVRLPEFDPADHRGAGDSMTAGLTAAMLRNLSAAETLKLASAAGAANVTRHGLGSASTNLIAELAERVEVEKIKGDS